MVCSSMRDRRFTAIIFDLDGTLIEVDDVKRRGDEILKMTLSERGVKRTRFKDRYEFWFSGGRFLRLLKKWGIESESEKRLFLDALSRNEYDVKRGLIESGEVRTYDDTDTLGRLQGRLKLGLVSNSSLKTVTLELDHFNLGKYFDSVIALGDFTNNLKPKPDPDGILQCMKELRESPANTLVVGDNPTDVIAGNRSQAQTALVTRGKHRVPVLGRIGTHAKVDFYVRTLSELEKMID
jgi:HAD superfamily hydrolase (TIGR01509 family)